jgi:signal transduction histidine kinase/ligand-binding sensor domain-containing protein/CheY-like chemotaxis protein
MRRFLFFIWFVSQATLLLSQEKQYLFTNHTKSDGLSYNRVQCFLKDSRGFIWIGTAEGLCCFDGYSFRNYKNIPGDTTSLRENVINSLFEDYEGNIWVGNGNYLDVYNPRTDIFYHSNLIFDGKLEVPPSSKWFHVRDNKGNIWFANTFKGIYKFEIKSHHLQKLNEDSTKEWNVSSKIITNMGADSAGNIWVVNTNATLEKINAQSLRVEERTNLQKGFDNMYRFIIDKDNDLWIFDWHNPFGILHYNTKTKSKTIISTTSKGTKINNNNISCIIEDDNQNIWLGTDHGGINIINKKTMRVQYVLNNPFNERSLPGDAVISLYRDYQGFIWVGTFKNGFSYYHPRLYNFNLFKVKVDDSKVPGYNDIDNFAEDKKGNIYIGTNGGGLIYFDRQNNTYKQYLNTPNEAGSIGANVIIGMYMDKNDNLWLGTYFGGLNKFDGKKFKRYKHKEGDVSTISDDRVWDICPSSDGKLWIATLLGGVNVFNPVTEKVEKIYRWNVDTTIRSNVVFSIIEARDKTMWFATVDGVRSFNPQSHKFSYYSYNPNNPRSLSKNYVLDIYEDSRGLIWVATSDGLNLFEKRTKTFRRFKTEDGLSSNMIMTIVEDKEHNLWLGTSNGLTNVIIDLNTQTNTYFYSFKTYDELDGLQGAEFNEKSGFVTSKGELLFGGNNGFNLFSPEDLKIKNIDAEIVFTDFQVFNKSINNHTSLNGRCILKNSISYTHEITLKYSENVFSIKFGCLNYFHPMRRQYKYILENFNTDWITTNGMNREATYTNLDPGKYIFRVRVTNTDGTWNNEKEAVLKIIIQPPWWRTWYFRISLILLLVSITILLYYVRVNQLQQQKNWLEKKVLERTNELSDANHLLEERQEEISRQNEELGMHRNQLETLVQERTSELEKAMRKAEESDKLKSAFLSNMSHEIRTPMNAIVGFSSMLNNNDVSDSERNEFIGIINQNSESLLVLINDILDISQIEANQMKINKTSFDVNKILDELYNYYTLIPNQNVIISFDNAEHDKKGLIINSDPVRFRQVVSNLVDNALKFTETGYVKFGYELKDDHVLFYVADSGIGINPENIDKIFNHFFKVENPNHKFYKGTGLGLAISKRIIELLGGNIWVESEVQKGTTFFFTLPYGQTNSITSPKEKIHTDSNIAHFRILIAEDEQANYFLIKSILKSSKAEIIWAQNGQEAVDYFKNTSNFKNLIVLMDIKMPVMNGIDAFKAIRKISPDVPIIALTAYALESDRFDIMKHGFTDYMAKPVRVTTLLELLKKYFPVL